MNLTDSKQRKSGVVISYITAFISIPISLIYTPILLTWLGQQEYGVYSLVASTASYLSLLSLGFGGAYIRFFTRIKSGDQKDMACYNGLYLTVFCVMGLIALILGLGLASHTSSVFKALTQDEARLAEELLKILALSVAISFPISVFDAIITAHECFVFQKILILVKRVLNPCIVVALLFLGLRSRALVYVTLLITVVSGFVSIYFAFSKLHIAFSFHNMPKRLLKEVFSYSVFIFVAMISDQVSWNLDKFLLGIYKSSSQIAIYGIAAQLNGYVLTFGDVVSNVFTPQIHKLSVSDDRENLLTALLIKVGRIQFFIVGLIALGYLFLGEQFILIWAGTDYKESYRVGLVLIGSITLPLIESITIEILRAMGLNKKYALIVILGVIVNLILSIPLCKYFGAMGCASGTAISLLITSWFLRNACLKKYAGIDTHTFFLQVLKLLPSLLLPIICGVLIKHLFPINGYFMLMLMGMVFVAVYFISVWFFGMNQFEKDYFIAPLGHIKKHLLFVLRRNK